MPVPRTAPSEASAAKVSYCSFALFVYRPFFQAMNFVVVLRFSGQSSSWTRSKPCLFIFSPLDRQSLTNMYEMNILNYSRSTLLRGLGSPILQVMGVFLINCTCIMKSSPKQYLVMLTITMTFTSHFCYGFTVHVLLLWQISFQPLHLNKWAIILRWKWRSWENTGKLQYLPKISWFAWVFDGLSEQEKIGQHLHMTCPKIFRN